MDAPAGWRRQGSGSGGARRPGATPALRTATNSSKSSTVTAQPRAASVGALRTPNQADERDIKARKSTSIELEAAPSRWREMRQSVRTKATLETAESCPVNAKIADLCPEDREKVTKLVHRIVEVGTLQEEGEREFSRQREVLEAEVKELRAQVRQDAEEIQELSDELRSATRKAMVFEERVLALEESTDAETRSRLEAEQTLDLLKLEVDKLRALVQRQQDEMKRRMKEQREQFATELRETKEELKEAQELLLKERNERVLEKQRALDQRLERTATIGEEKLDRLHSLLREQQEEIQLKAKEQQEEMQLNARKQQERFDAEMKQLKEELKAANELLQQERLNQVVEKEELAPDPIERAVETVQDERLVAPQEQVPASRDRSSERFSTSIDSDLAVFEEVKDLYAEDLFASRRWGGLAATSAPAPVRPTSNQFDSTWREALRPGNMSLGPALSAQELSVQEAIEKDMEALLRSEALHTLDVLQ
ncbi:hypothetical protein PRIC1_005742 [Phytophthora ramorum]